MEFRNHARILFISASAVLLVALAPPAASAQAGTGAFELYGGYYFPDEDLLDDDLTYGIRGTYRWTDALAFEATVGRYEEDLGFGVDFELTLVDFSTAWTLNPGSPTEFAFFAGPGWAFLDVSAPFGLSASDDTFTVHAGVDLQIPLSDRIYLRPDARARYFEQSEDVDLEASVAIGFRIGG